MQYLIKAGLVSLILLVQINANPYVLFEEPKMKKEWDILDKTEYLEATFTNRHKSGTFDGVVVISRKGSIIYENAFGYANRKEKKAFSINYSKFQLASVSKPITSVAILKLVEEGLLDLDKTVKDYVPNFPYENVTLSLLLNHRSGLTEYMYVSDKYWKNHQKAMTNQDVLEMFIESKPEPYYPPDTKYNYVNTNFVLLAALAEKVKNKPFPEILEEYVFIPFGMETASVYHPETIKDPTPGVPSYRSRGKKVVPSYLDGACGDKGVYASAYDLIKFIEGVKDTSLFSAELKELAFGPPENSNLFDHDNYGLGWRVNEQPTGDRIMFHGGWWRGNKSNLLYIEEDDVTVALLTNCTKGSFSTSTLYNWVQTTLVEIGEKEYKDITDWYGVPLQP